VILGQKPEEDALAEVGGNRRAGMLAHELAECLLEVVVGVAAPACFEMLLDGARVGVLQLAIDIGPELFDGLAAGDPVVVAYFVPPRM
jgi:hypothetical protein